MPSAAPLSGFPLDQRGDVVGGDLLEAGHQQGEQIVAKLFQRREPEAIAPHEEVVDEHGKRGDREAEAGHDQRLAHGAGDLVQTALTGGTDGQQGVVDAPDGAEQPDEGAAEPTEARKASPCSSRTRS